jgi:hypothetical protein
VGYEVTVGGTFVGLIGAVIPEAVGGTDIVSDSFFIHAVLRKRMIVSSTGIKGIGWT